MFIIEKKLMDEGQRKFGFPFNLGDLLSHTVGVKTGGSRVGGPKLCVKAGW